MLSSIKALHLPKQHIAVHTDASVRLQKIGLGKVTRVNELTKAKHARVMGPNLHMDNNLAEMLAILWAIHKEDAHAPLAIYTDSQTSIDLLKRDKYLFHPKFGQAVTVTRHMISKRKEPTYLLKVKAHSTDEMNNYADHLAKRGANMDIGSLFGYELYRGVEIYEGE